MYKISKEFNLAYGHRVHTQKLEESMCARGDSSCKCRFLHGHEGVVTVSLESKYVDNRGMVVDFKEMGWIKDFIDNNLDHKCIIDRNDPMFGALVKDIYYSATGNSTFKTNQINVNSVLVGETVDLSKIEPGTPVYEVLEGYFIVNFVPTSENLAKWMYDIVSETMKSFGCKVSEVSWRETAKSIARYYG